MKKVNVKMILGLQFTALVLFLILIAIESKAERIIVAQDGSGDFEKIQDAIDNATKGDTIRVWEGTYYENVVVNKTVSLVGNGSEETTIDGEVN